MDRLLIGFLHIGIALCIFHLGKWMSAAKNPQLLALIEKIKIGDLKNISPRYTMNYIGYFIQFSGITYFALAFMGPFSIAPYLTIPGVAIAAIIYHIASAKNCSPSEAFNKLQLNKNAF